MNAKVISAALNIHWAGDDDDCSGVLVGSHV
jgi:hypothetical protein